LLFGWVTVDHWYSEHRRAQMLYKTDHRALLAACRQLMTNQQILSKYDDPHSIKIYIPEHDPDLPKAIVSLNPVGIETTGSSVEVAMGGGFDHYGFIALSEKEEQNLKGAITGIEPVSGLWYYDENLVQLGEPWLKKLKEMRPRGTPEPAWRV